MSPRQRAQVVELLRCGADLAAEGRSISPGGNAAWLLRSGGVVIDVTQRAMDSILDEMECNYDTLYADVFVEAALEAALRVEQGWTP